MENRLYVSAMRIYLEDEHQPMADLAIMKDGDIIGIKTIRYDSIEEREAYYINAYTLIWDERISEIGQSFETYCNL